MDKKLNKDLVDFFYGNPDTWDKILIEDTHRKKGKIGSCCSSHALEQFVSHYDPKAVEPLFESNDLLFKSMIKSIKKGLDINVLNVIGDWRCDDDEHNEDIDKILDIAKKEMKKKKK